MRSFVHSFVRLFVHSFVYSFVRSFVRSFVVRSFAGMAAAAAGGGKARRWTQPWLGRFAATAEASLPK